MESVISMNIKNHGFGIVQFDDVISFDKKILFDLINFLEYKNEQSFTYFTEGGVEYAINKGGFKFRVEDIKYAPSRFTDLSFSEIEHSISNIYKSIIQNIDQALYRCLVEYCRIFPDAAKTIWWKTPGHIAGYKQGQLIGPHSDSHIEYDFVNDPTNQHPIHNTVSSGLYLNSCAEEVSVDDLSFSGGEINFPHADFSFKPKEGSVIMYPSNYIGRHEVKPVTKGSRYVYLQFFSYGKSDKIDEKSIHWLPNLQKDVRSDS